MTMFGETRCSMTRVVLVLMVFTIITQFVISATIPADCVERSLCYHSSDCCNGCCEDHQCVTDTTTGSACSDANIPRNCSSLTCAQDQECAQETRFCLIAPCPQPLPKCVLKKPPRETDVPLPVQYTN